MVAHPVKVHTRQQLLLVLLALRFVVKPAVAVNGPAALLWLGAERWCAQAT